MDELTSVYIQESREQLAEMEAGLLRLEQNPDDSDNINAIFRAAHTIKGGSGVIECAFIEHFTHLVENLLDSLRNGELEVTGPITTLLLECCDHMGSLVDTLAAQSPAPDEALQARGNALTEQLKAIIEAHQSTSGSSNLTLHDDLVETLDGDDRGGGLGQSPAAHFGDNNGRVGRNADDFDHDRPPAFFCILSLLYQYPEKNKTRTDEKNVLLW